MPMGSSNAHADDRPRPAVRPERYEDPGQGAGSARLPARTPAHVLRRPGTRRPRAGRPRRGPASAGKRRPAAKASSASAALGRPAGTRAPRLPGGGSARHPADRAAACRPGASPLTREAGEDVLLRRHRTTPRPGRAPLYPQDRHELATEQGAHHRMAAGPSGRSAVDKAAQSMALICGTIDA